MSLKRFLIGLFICFLSISCGNGRKIEIGEEYFKEYRENMKLELAERAIFLAYKHSLDKSDTEKLLLQYLNQFDNHSYQLITTGDFNIQTMKVADKRKERGLHVFIDEYYDSDRKLSKHEIANVLFDYEQILNIEEVKSLSGILQDLLYSMEGLDKR